MFVAPNSFIQGSSELQHQPCAWRQLALLSCLHFQGEFVQTLKAPCKRGRGRVEFQQQRSLYRQLRAQMLHLPLQLLSRQDKESDREQRVIWGGGFRNSTFGCVSV